MTTDTPSSRDEEIPTPRHDDVDSLPSGQWPHVAMKEAKKLFADTPRTAAIIPVLRYHPGNSAWNQALLLARQLERDLIRISAERDKDKETFVAAINLLNAEVEHERTQKNLRHKAYLEQTATLAERDKELAELKAKLESEGKYRMEDQAFMVKIQEDSRVAKNKLIDQLLAAQTELASIPARVESDEIVCDRCGESCGRVNLPVPRTSTSPDPTLLDEVKREKELIKDVEESLAAIDKAIAQLFWTSDDGSTQRDGTPEDGDAPPFITEAWKDIRSSLSRLRQSTRETEEKV